MIELSFREELFGRLTHIGQHCAYLRQTATESDSTTLKSLLEEILKQVALNQPLTRSGLVRRLARRYNQTDVYLAVNRLIDTDFLAEENRVLTLLDPLFGLWLASEPARQDPQGILTNQKAVQKLIAWYEQRHAEDRTTMGMLFEKRVENLVRQFGGQAVEGKLFGVQESITLPMVRKCGPVRVDDPRGLYGGGRDSYQVDIVTEGDSPADCWEIEAKHRRGAVTAAMVERFLKSVRALEKAQGIAFARLWIVADRGVRAEAADLIRAEKILTSGARQIGRLEQLAADGWRDASTR